MIINLIASLSFFIVPYLTGRFFTKKTVNAWIFGSLIWFAAFFVLSFIVSFTHLAYFRAGISLLAILSSLASVLKLLASRIKFTKPKTEYLLLLPVLIFASLAYFLIWKRNTPYPLELNWDIYEHITLANLISQGKISFLTTRVSDTFTFNSYSPLFQVLLALPKILFQRSLVGAYWFLEYWYFLLTIIASFILAFRVFNNKLAAFVMGVISSLIFESIVIYSPLFLIPQTLVALTTIYILPDLGKEKVKSLVPVLLFLFLLHYIVGALCVLAVVFLYAVNRKPKLLNTSIILSLIILVFLVLLNLVGNWKLVGIEEAAHFTFSLSEKLTFFSNWYGIGLLIPFVVGLLYIVRRGNTEGKLILTLSFMTLGLSLSPFSYFLKFYALGAYFVNLIIAFGLTILLTGLPKVFKFLGFSFITLSLVIVFYKNQLTYKDPLHFGNLETQLSQSEIDAGDWLFKNEKDAFLISDPGTQYILEALSQVNTQGGVYMNQFSRKDLISIDNSSDYNLIREKLLDIHDSLIQNSGDRLFVVGGRYFAWQRLSKKEKGSSFYNIWSPKVIKEDDRKYLDFLKDSPYFVPVFENSELVIFKVK